MSRRNGPVAGAVPDERKGGRYTSRLQPVPQRASCWAIVAFRARRLPRGSHFHALRRQAPHGGGCGISPSVPPSLGQANEPRRDGTSRPAGGSPCRRPNVSSRSAHAASEIGTEPAWRRSASRSLARTEAGRTRSAAPSANGGARRALVRCDTPQPATTRSDAPSSSPRRPRPGQCETQIIGARRCRDLVALTVATRHRYTLQCGVAAVTLVRTRP
jgi:hypothetical protein